jgi:hypothetical protein
MGVARSVLAFGAAVAGWTAFSLGLLAVDPGGAIMLPLCGRLIDRSAECDAQIEAANQAHWLGHTLPELSFVLLGFIAIAVIALRWRLKRAPGGSARV